jgi:hypothetical protein
MTTIDDSERYEPWNRLIDDHPWLTDMQELKTMSPADKAHYASTPGGSKHTSISRGS